MVTMLDQVKKAPVAGKNIVKTQLFRPTDQSVSPWQPSVTREKLYSSTGKKRLLTTLVASLYAAVVVSSWFPDWVALFQILFPLC